MIRIVSRVAAALAGLLLTGAPGFALISAYNGGSTLGYCSASDVEGHAVDVPSIDASQSGTDVNVSWDGDGWNKWHFRWGQNGGPEKAYEYGGGQKSFRIRNVGTCQRFTLKIQGCVTHYIGKDRCSPFEEASFTSAPQRPYGPDTCAQGFVWRDAFPNDHVCVPPPVRDQAKADNARRQMAPCPAPLVPRKARASDAVCVTAAVADAVRRDNAGMCSRLVKC